MNTQDKRTVACHGCGTELAWVQVTRIEVKVGKQWETQPHCRHCAANRAAKQAFGGMYLTMASGPNRAARRQQAQAKAPVVKPAKQRRATRGERRAAKKVAAAKQSKKEAA